VWRGRAPSEAKCRTRFSTKNRCDGSGARRTAPVDWKEALPTAKTWSWRGYLKPISTLRQPLHTADMVTKEPVKAAYERSDWCVVPAGAVAGEAMVALVLADAFLQKFGGDSFAEMRRNFDNYARQIDEF